MVEPKNWEKKAALRKLVAQCYSTAPIERLRARQGRKLDELDPLVTPADIKKMYATPEYLLISPDTGAPDDTGCYQYIYAINNLMINRRDIFSDYPMMMLYSMQLFGAVHFMTAFSPESQEYSDVKARKPKLGDLLSGSLFGQAVITMAGDGLLYNLGKPKATALGAGILLYRPCRY